MSHNVSSSIIRMLLLYDLQSVDPVPVQRGQDHVRPDGGGDGEHQGPHPPHHHLQHRRCPRPLPRVLSPGRGLDCEEGSKDR